MRAIAKSVGASKAALYYRFRRKEQLFLAILETYLDMMTEEIQEVRLLSLPARQRLELLAARILSRPTEQRAVIRSSCQEITFSAQRPANPQSHPFTTNSFWESRRLSRRAAIMGS